jgi:hypothetical protein
MAAGPARTVEDTLALFESTFSEFADAFHEGQYVLWLGSGISRDRVPSVDVLLERVIEHLRLRAEAEPSRGYHAALSEVLGLACLTRDELDSIDFASAVHTWPLRDRIVATLVSQYSRVLDVPVGDDSPEDYLVWTGLDVPNTYGSPDLEPDVEHYCIALLMLEGLVASAVSANWDGLIEKALAELMPASDSLVRVAVKAEDFRIGRRPIDVLKFHGCAVRARSDEVGYRGLLIARQSQISGWTVRPEHAPMRQHLETLYRDRPTLMVGLSAQDANLHTVFAGAIQDLARPWPASPPAVVLSEERLEAHHRHVLKLTYGNDYLEHAEPIVQSALLGAYAKPTLLALLLSSLTDKLSFLVAHSLKDTWGSTEADLLKGGLLLLRDSVASHADPSGGETREHEINAEVQRGYLARFIDTAHFVLTVFRTGRAPSASDGRYRPLSDRPVAESVLGADFPADEFGRLGVALSLIGRGLAAGDWSVAPGDRGDPSSGVLCLTTGKRSTPVFFVKDAATLLKLELDESLIAGDECGLIVIADEEPPESPRSSATRYGRGGRQGAARFSVAANIAEAASADDLFEAFRLAGGL